MPQSTQKSCDMGRVSVVEAYVSSSAAVAGPQPQFSRQIAPSFSYDGPAFFPRRTRADTESMDESTPLIALGSIPEMPRHRYTAESSSDSDSDWEGELPERPTPKGDAVYYAGLVTQIIVVIMLVSGEVLWASTPCKAAAGR